MVELMTISLQIDLLQQRLSVRDIKLHAAEMLFSFGCAPNWITRSYRALYALTIAASAFAIAAWAARWHV